MIIGCCIKCKRLDEYVSDEQRCLSCGGNMISLGIEGREFNKLDVSETNSLIERRIEAYRQNSEFAYEQPIQNVINEEVVEKPTIKLTTISDNKSVFDIFSRYRDRIQTICNQYDEDCKEIQSRIRRIGSIDIFDDSAFLKVSEIVTFSRESVDNFYTGAQTNLHVMCKELAAMGETINISKQLAKDIYDFIKKINDLSDISIDYSATFNTTRLGDVAIIHYSPSLENKVYEGFWETRSYNINENSAVDNEYIAITNAFLEEKRVKDKQDSIKKENENMQKASQGKQLVSKVQEVYKKREEEIAKINQPVTDNQKKYEEASAKIKQIESELNGTNVFSIGKRNELKAEIKKVQAQVESLEKEREELNSPSSIRQRLNETQKINAEYPLPYELQAEIEKILIQYPYSTISDICEKSEVLREFPSTVMSSCIKEMVDQGDITKDVSRKTVTYHL